MAQRRPQPRSSDRSSTAARHSQDSNAHSQYDPNPTGQRVDHDDLILEVLAPHLHWLDHQNPQTAIALRHLLTWKMRRSDPFPGLAALELIRAADRISARFAPIPLGNSTATNP